MEHPYFITLEEAEAAHAAAGWVDLGSHAPGLS